MISLKHVSKSFGPLKAVDDASLEVKKGEIICLIGPSGSGKSTLLRCIAGLEDPEEGEVWIDGERLDLHSKDQKKLEKLRIKMGFVFQHFNRAGEPHPGAHSGAGHGQGRRGTACHGTAGPCGSG